MGGWGDGHGRRHVKPSSHQTIPQSTHPPPKAHRFAERCVALNVKMTVRNNPLTWLLGLIVGFISLVLIINLLFGSTPYEGMPANVLIAPGTPAAATEADSVTLAAAEVFAASGAQRFLYGDMYRDAWATPVTVPVLRLDTFRGGLRPVKKGGGFQTLSLDVIDTAGVVYTLRSVTKDPSKLVPDWAPKIGITNLITDGISAGHPYGAMAAAALSDLAGLPHMHPQLYYVPAQAALDSFSESVGDRLFWLEYEPDGHRAPWLGMASFDKWEDSDDVFEAWRADSLSAKPDLRALVRARLFDIWVGDWDRHDGQWGWARTVDSATSVKTYTPVANDRDNIFYGISGAIPLAVAAFEKRLQPFGTEVDDMGGLTLNSQFFDRAFLHGVPERVFVEEAEALKAKLSDAGIERALRVWPAAIYALDGEEIGKCLRSRRDELVEYASDFYEVIQERGASDRVENEF